ncbi:Cytochrome c oxidase, subunit VIa/COX13 [Phaffia rhodozyma]|uniref:Cytochrome c oxidase, subunit VIa/COX13 n=1 Tax=Phaffia rhodozyma TaxID=264483 RepID=A0A0F7SHP4_PHARH|nr:Cytochrome c oxidase, subunit VIa/COX13 [Phaffia rhodozyma]
MASILRSTIARAPRATIGLRASSNSVHTFTPAGCVPMYAQKAIKEADLPVRETAWSRERDAMRDHAPEASELWRKVTYYVALPCVIVAGIWTYKKETEHAAHIEHEIEANGGSPPERVVYEYMLRRTKPFPWSGNQSLFHNDKTNIRASEEFGA